MRLFDEEITEKIAEFMDREGKEILKAAGIGALYYIFKKIGGEFSPFKGLTFRFGDDKGLKFGTYSAGYGNRSTVSAINALYSAACNCWSDYGKVEYAEKIVNLVENATEIDENAKNEAINSLTKLMNNLWSECNKRKIADYIVEITEI